MESIKPTIIKFAIMKGKMNQPLTVTEGLLFFANSMIKPGSKLEMKVINYVHKRGQLAA